MDAMQAASAQSGVLPDAPALEGDDEEDKAALISVVGEKVCLPHLLNALGILSRRCWCMSLCSGCSLLVFQDVGSS